MDDLEYEREVISGQLEEMHRYLSESLLKHRGYSPVAIPAPRMFGEAVGLVEKEEIVYIGETKAGKPQGRGLIFYRSTGKAVEGQFRNGHLEGRGTLYFRNGDVYSGDFHDDKKQGRGVYFWKDDKSDAQRYEGEFKNSKRNGRGVFLWNDGSRYEGQFLNGLQHGQGVLFRADGSREYEGDWEAGAFNGRGVQLFENGEVYEGAFKDDKFHGQGTFTKLDSVINGEWKDNELVKVNIMKSLLSAEKDKSER